jgi:TonB family protein
MVFLVKPGLGGGGGNRQPAPPSRAQGIGKDRITLPVTRPVVALPVPIDTPSPPEQLLLDAIPLASGTTYVVGLPEGLSSLGSSQGPGVGGGIGEGVGTGIGPGTGPGMGPGSGGGFGGGAYRLGGGVTPPTLLKEVKPVYTVEALRQRIQGTVMLEVVVTREGMPGDIRVTRSLDPGLDVEAVRATRQWLFNPGRLGGTPVDVLVTIFMDFRLN